MTNIIILTHGWTGSSIFAALFGRAGHWLGAETVQKFDYDTHENAGLVAMNRQLLDQLAPGINHEHHFSHDEVELIARRGKDMELGALRSFVRDCGARGAWLWKDPRLTWTVRVWSRVIPQESVSYLILTRETTQAWVSSNLRRHVQSLRFTRDYNDGITESNLRFVRQTGRPHLVLSFEDLLLRPEVTLDRLNSAFATSLSMADLQAVCHQPLYRKSRNLRDFAVASLIYLKNFAERDGRGRRAV